MWTKCSADLSLTLKPPAYFTGKENQRTEKSSDLPPSHTSQKSQNLPLVTLLAEAHGSPLPPRDLLPLPADNLNIRFIRCQQQVSKRLS